MSAKAKDGQQANRITVALLEDSYGMLLGLQAELRKPDITVTVVSDNVDRFLDGIKTAQPDIAIVDLRIGSDFKAGYEAIRKARELSPGTKYIIETAYDDLESFDEGIKLGAKAFVGKGTDEKPLDEVVRAVYQGFTYYGDYVEKYRKKVQESSAQLEWTDGEEKAVGGDLTKRQAEVLDLLDQGKDKHEIAKMLYVAPNTVKAHIEAIHKKFGVRTTPEAIRLYRLRRPD